MIHKYNRGIFLIFIISLLVSFNSAAQTMKQDSVVKEQNIAYGTQPSWMVSGAISTVEGSELEQSFASNLANTLYGKLPGLTVMQGGAEPGEDSPTLYIRGLNTFGTGTNPLIIVDGFESSFEKLVPEEIESVSLLKDASATAIYGSRGANGVLLVTTKRGVTGPLQISISTKQGFQNAMRLPDFLGSYDYAKLYNEALNNDGLPEFYTAADLAAYQSGSNPYFYPDVNWYDELLRKMAPVSNYNLNFKGGGEGIRYFLSINSLTSNGLYKKTGDESENSENASFTKYNFRSNVDINMTKRLSVSVNLGGIIENKTTPGANSTSPIFDKMATIPPNAFPVHNPNGSWGGNNLYSNPYGDILESGFYTSSGRIFQATLKLTEQLDFITEGLSISGAASYNSYSRSHFNKTREYARYAISKDALGNTVYNMIGQNTSLSGEVGHDNLWRNYALQSFLNYDRTFGNQTVNAMVMFNYDNYAELGSNQPFEHLGAGGRLTYTNNEKYIGEFSFGYYGSENFPEGNRFGFFPAVSVGWIASNESFLKGSNIINYLKIRGSYGMVGNDDIGGRRFMFYQEYESASGYYWGSGNDSYGGTAEGPVANTNVTWEKEKKLNIGFEATVFDHVDVALDVFDQNRYDILAKPYNELPQFLGMELPDLNVGEVNNKGIEAMLRFNSNQTGDLKYFVEADIWYAKNEIVYNSEAYQEFDYLYQTGNPVGQPMLLEAIGFFKDQADIDASPKQIFTTVIPGDIKYKDQNNDNIIDQNDYYPIGKPSVPELTVALSTGVKFKGFDLSLLFQAVTNRSVYLSGNYFHAFQNNAKISSFALDRWTPSTAGSADYPRLSSDNNLNNYQPSSLWQYNGSFIKLRNIELGYSFPENLAGKMKMDDVRVFINGTNLFSLDQIDFTDSETLNGYPAFRTLSIGAKIKF